MLKITSLSILLLSLSFITYGQKPRIKEVIAITIDYHHTPNPVSVNTLITKYDTSGVIISPPHEKFLIDSMVTIDSTEKFLHYRQYDADGTRCDTYTTYYKDSSITYTTLDDTIHKRVKDTIFKEIGYLKGRKAIKTIEYYKGKGNSYKIDKETTTSADNIFVKVWEEKDDYRTYRYRFNKISKTQKQYSFNDSLKEWYMSKKEKFNSKGRTKKLVTQMYHDYFKQYFKEFTYYSYNRYGKKTLVITKGNYGDIEKKEVYLYTYYK